MHKLNILYKLIIIVYLTSLINADDDNPINWDLFSLDMIPSNMLLEYENIADTMLNKDAKAEFYFHVSIEIKNRIKKLDKKFFTLQKNYINKIQDYEQSLKLPKQNLRIYMVDLRFNNMPDTLYINYYKNKNLTKKTALFYIQKSFRYKNIIDDLEEYYEILKKLHNSNKLNEFRISIKQYSDKLEKINSN